MEDPSYYDYYQNYYAAAAAHYYQHGYMNGMTPNHMTPMQSYYPTYSTEQYQMEHQQNAFHYSPHQYRSPHNMYHPSPVNKYNKDSEQGASGVAPHFSVWNSNKVVDKENDTTTNNHGHTASTKVTSGGAGGVSTPATGTSRYDQFFVGTPATGGELSGNNKENMKKLSSATNRKFGDDITKVNKKQHHQHPMTMGMRAGAVPHNMPSSTTSPKDHLTTTNSNNNKQVFLHSYQHQQSFCYPGQRYYNNKRPYNNNTSQSKNNMLSNCTASDEDENVKRSKRVDLKQQFNQRLLDEDVRITTLMVKNIPNKLTRENVLKSFQDEGIDVDNEVDFFYIPRDGRRASNLGYCFINFLSPEQAKAFVRQMEGFSFPSSSSKKVLSICPAHVQGLESLEAHFKNAHVRATGDGPSFLLDGSTTSATATSAPASGLSSKGEDGTAAKTASKTTVASASSTPCEESSFEISVTVPGVFSAASSAQDHQEAAAPAEDEAHDI